MSAFDDENPFAVSPSGSTSRPVAFIVFCQDPSVQKAVEGTGANANLNDFNPFEAQKNATLTPASSETVSGVKPAAATQEAPPAYTPSGQQQISSADFQVTR